MHYLSIGYADRLAANDIVASVGSKGDSYDNALAESFNGLYEWELIYWRGLDDVEFATITYVDRFNHRRLHGTITAGSGYTTPAAHEAAYYRLAAPALEPVTQARAATEPGAIHLAENPWVCLWWRSKSHPQVRVAALALSWRLGRFESVAQPGISPRPGGPAASSLG